MPRAKRKPLKHIGVTDAHVFQLLVGWDFFHDAFGDDLDGMKSAWADPSVRRRVYDLFAERRAKGIGQPRTRPWAADYFDDLPAAGRGD